MADILFRIPEPGGATVVIRRGILKLEILMDGQPLRRGGRFNGPYLLPGPDGSVRELRLIGDLNLTLVVDGTRYPLERRLRGYEYLLAGLPLILVIPGAMSGALGAALGFGLGYGGTFVNTRIARSGLRAPIRVLSMIGLSAALAIVYIVVIIALSGAVRAIFRPDASESRFVVGSCFVGSTEAGSGIDLRAVDCDTPHDTEVVGAPVYPGEGSGYPGEAALDGFARTACPASFAAYVGRPYDGSPYGMVYLTPEADGWRGGEHAVRCLATALDDEKLTASLAGSAQPALTPMASPAAGLPDGWITYVPPDGSYSVALPGAPYFESSPVEPAEGPSYVDHEIGWVSADRSTGYWVNTFEYPTGSLSGTDPAAYYDVAQANALAAVDATLLTERDIVLDGHPGREYTAMAQGVTVAVRMYLVGDRLFNQDTNAIAPIEGDVEAFFESFELPTNAGFATWWVDPRWGPLTADTTVVSGFLVEQACAGGQSPEGRVADPLIEYRADAVVVTYSVALLPGAQDCQGNPEFRVELTLAEPLGERTLLDGGSRPPRDATTTP